MSAVAGTKPLYCPAHYAELVDRGATVLHARWPASLVEFSFWALDEERSYLARIDWPALAAGPRVVVFDARSGDFRCQSKEGSLYEIDPAVIVVDTPPDEIDRYGWEQAERLRGKRAA